MAVSLNCWSVSDDGKTFSKSTKKYTIELRYYGRYDWHGWTIHVVYPKTKRERQIHLLYGDKPETVASTNMAKLIERANEFFSEPICVQDEIFNGTLEY